MKHTRLLLLAAMLLSFGGAYVSWTLLNKHMGTANAPAWLNALCESGQGGHVSCDKVLASRWAWLPPKRPGDPKDMVRYPVAGLGVAYYTLLLTWFVGVGRCNYAGRRWHLLPLLVNVLGVLGSVGFICVMAFALDTWCPLCLATHIINVALLEVNVLLRPRKATEASEAKRGQPMPAGESVEPRHPTVRLAMVVIGLGVFLIGSINQGSRIRRLLLMNAGMRRAIEEVQHSAESLLAIYQNEKAQHIRVRPDDPIRHNGAHLPAMVLWSDFECSHCRKFDRDFENKYLKDFAGQLRIVYKHYPLCSDCNRYVKKRIHPNACKAAELAEAVRLQGGNEKFWQVHDLLFEQQLRLKELDPREVAGTLGLDPDRLVADMNSEGVKRRIAEDVEQGHKLGVTGTPAVFLGGRQISNLARGVPAFWKMMGSIAIQTHRQQQSRGIPKLTPTGATPGSQDRRGAR